MKKLTALSVLAFSIGSATAIADTTLTEEAGTAQGGVEMGLTVPKSCSLNIDVADLTLDLANTNTSGYFTQSIPLGTNTCNASTYWKMATANGGLVNTAYSGTDFINMVPYSAVISFQNGNNAALTTNGVDGHDNLSSTGSYPQTTAFTADLSLVVSSLSALSDASSYAAGDFNDELTITVGFVP